MIDDAQVQRIVRFLTADVSTTVVTNCERLILEEAARVRAFVDGADHYEERVVGDVQQRLHDEFIDTTWPACPEHSNHPLWFSDGWWRCPTSGNVVAELGRLSRRRSPPA